MSDICDRSSRAQGHKRILAKRIGSAMLVLSRKVGERILVGENVTITVVRLTNGGVRLGIEAPTEMSVVREEVVQKKPVVPALDELKSTGR